MTELQSHNNGFSNIAWLNRRNMSSASTTTTYSQQPQQPQQPQQQPQQHQQQQGSFNATYYAHQLPPINSISSTSTSISQLNHEPLNLTEDERKQQQQLISWDMPSATTTTDSTVSATSSYEPYHNHNTVSPPSPSMSTDKASSVSSSKKQRLPSTKDIHVEKNTDGKPPYSYATLIKYAIENSPNNKLTLSEIYQWVLEHYPYYGTAGSGWKNSIRHNLSLNKSFVRVARPINEPGKGSYWMVDYRSAETEQRTRQLLPTSSRRNNRSGSDPSSNTPYRPEWSDSLSSSSSTSSFGRRDMRDTRSLSMDAAALSKNLNGVGLNGSYSTGNYKSMASHGTDGSGYYGNAYAYGRHFATNHHPHHHHHHQQQQQQHRTTTLRHSNYMPSTGYNVYMENMPADQTQYHHQQQLPGGNNQPTTTVHHSSTAKQQHSNYVYDQAAAATSTANTSSTQPMYYSYGSGQPSPAPTSIIEKSSDPTKSTAEHAVYSTFSPTPSAQLPSPFVAPTTTATYQQQQQQPNYHPHHSSVIGNQSTSSCINDLATATIKDEKSTPVPSTLQDRRLFSVATSGSSSPSNSSSPPSAVSVNTVNPSCFYPSHQNPMNLAQASSSPSVKPGKQETTAAGDFDWDTVL
ncbi:unnamed protein product [Absidia cylindrospora]